MRSNLLRIMLLGGVVAGCASPPGDDAVATAADTAALASPGCGPDDADWPTLDPEVTSRLASLPEPTTPDPAVPAVQRVGRLEGEPTVSQGIAGYRVPLFVAPGRVGMEPDLALQYTSSGGSELAGVGWSLQGVSRIHRCARTRAQDGAVAPPSFGGDALCLDGQRLVVVEGTYGAANAVYRTEVDSFARIRQTGALDQPAMCFTMEQKDGRVAVFGGCQDASARHILPGPAGLASTTRPLAWPVERIVDRAGNEIDFDYAVEDGQHLLRRIWYTGFRGQRGTRRVELEYQARSDVEIAYQLRAEVRSVRRLHAITSFVDATLARRYQLGYTASPATGRSLLTSVTACLGVTCTSSNSLPATVFEYQGDAPAFAAEPVAIADPDRDYVLQTADYDGDGTRDRWRLSFPEPWGGAPTRSVLELSTGAAIDLTSAPWFAGFDRRYDGNPGGSDVDFDADGRVDLQGTSGGAFAIASWNPSTRQFDQQTSNLLLGSHAVVHARDDFDGDGRSDVLVADGGRMTIRLQCATSAAGRVDFCGAVDLGPIPACHEVMTTSDLDGNGLPDVLFDDIQGLGGNCTGAPYVVMLASGGGGLTARTVTVAALGGPAVSSLRRVAGLKLLDLNGDGLLDFFNLGTWTAWVNEGSTGDATPATRFRATSVADPGVTASHGLDDATIVADIDQDGRTELLVPERLVVPWCYLLWEAGDGAEPIEYCSGSSIDFDVSGAPRGADHTIYGWDILDLDLDATGAVVASLRTTNLEAPVRRNGPRDWDGDGLIDVHFRIADLYGTTREDVVAVLGSYAGSAPAPGAWVARRTGGAPDLLVVARDGVGARASFAYAPLSSRGVASCAMPFAPRFYAANWAAAPRDGIRSLFASSMHVVARLDRTSGVGGSNGVCYAYEDAWMHRRGRGFLGFGAITESEDTADPRGDLRTARRYHRDFPLNGRPQREVKQRVTDPFAATPIERTVWDWSVTGCSPEQAPTEVCNVVLDARSVETRDLATRALLGTVATDDVYTAADRPYGNLSARIVTTTDAQQQQVVRTDYTFDYSAASSAWWIDRLQRKTETFAPIVAARGPAAPVVPGGQHRIVTDYTYWTSGGGVRRVEWERVQPADRAQAHSTFSQYDAYGNPTQVRVEAARALDRTTTTAMTADGYFVARTTNPAGHVTQVRTDARFGVPTRITDANGLVTAIGYDAFGRRIETAAPGVAAVYERLLGCTAATCPPRAVLRELTIQAGAPTRTRYLDALERPVRETVAGFGAVDWVIDREYDPRGRLIARSEPGPGTARYFTRYLELDARGRPARKVIDRAGQPPIEIAYRYTGLDTTITVPGAPAPIRQTHDLLQRLVAAVDGSGRTTTYRYDPRGNLSLIRNAGGDDTVIDYDARGRKLATRDPDRGVRTFAYDGHGQLLLETDANGQTTERTYDRLGRPTTRIVGGFVDAEWRYDKTWRGEIDFERGGGGRYCRGHAYDGFGRPTQTTTFIDGRPLTVVQAYDALGRGKGLAYPSGRVIGHERSDRGYLVSEVDAATRRRYRTITAMSPHGEVIGERFGNGLVGVYDLDPASWQPLRLRVEDTSPFGTQLVQDLRYAYAHPFGQVTEQRNALLGIAETYAYDTQFRIAQATRTAGTASSTIDYGYDAIGNLVRKSDHALAITYGSASRAIGNAGPHAIVSYEDRAGVTVGGFRYDDNGNRVDGDGLTVSYDAFDRPRSLTRGGQTVRFAYGPGLGRFERATGTSTTHYVDRWHERVVVAGAVTQRDYLGDKVVITRLPSGAEHVRYLHLDRLGSVDTTTDEQRKVVDQNGYDPFGGPRNAKWVATPILAGAATDRGFTAHEHVDDVRVIHMNGRAYDYALGRFLSADPYIVDPADARSLDPYSYVRNDPLGRIDPTGYEDDALDKRTIESIELVKVTQTGSHIAHTEVEIRYSDGSTATLTPAQAKIAFGEQGLKALAIPQDTNRPGTSYRIAAAGGPREPEERSPSRQVQGKGNAKIGVRVGPAAVKTDGGDVSVEASAGMVTVGVIRKENGNPAAKIEVGPRFEPQPGLELRATAGAEVELAPDADTFAFGRVTEYLKAKLSVRAGAVSVEPEVKVERSRRIQVGLGTADAVRDARARLGKEGGGLDYPWNDVHGK